MLLPVSREFPFFFPVLMLFLPAGSHSLEGRVNPTLLTASITSDFSCKVMLCD
jgi:hypothetical protein